MENKRNKYIFMILIILCIMLIVLSTVRDGLVNPIRNTIGYVLVPLQTGVNRVGIGIYSQIQNRKNLQDLEAENRALQEKLDFLIEENNVLQQDLEELWRLRELYDLDQEYLSYEKTAAHIIAKDSENWFQVFRIDKGSRDGIRVDQNVIANGGLVGIVTDVGLNYATIRSIIDDESRVSCMGMQSRDSCIVAGDLQLFEEGRLRITNLDKDAPIQDGDRIVTSNISSKFVPGILVGYAVGIEEDEKRLQKNGYLIPAANFDDLSEVLVILDVKSDQFLEEPAEPDASETETFRPENPAAEIPASEDSDAAASLPPEAVGLDAAGLETAETDAEAAGAISLDTPNSEIPAIASPGIDASSSADAFSGDGSPGEARPEGESGGGEP